MAQFFDKLGIYGFPENNEDAILACILTGDPALLIGKQGTAKTALAESIGEALRQRALRWNKKNPGKEIRVPQYRMYDSSKINFEDLIGFPNPSAMQEGRMDFIQSPMTAWGADLIVFDEFNRQEPARQNNIFELIRSRRLMGRPTGTKWIINCMNPFGMAGTEELDDAIIDRHQFFVHVSGFNDLKDTDQDKIVKHVGNSDAVALKMWANESSEFDVAEGAINEKFADAGDYLAELMNKAANHYKTLRAEAGDNYAWFIARYWRTLESEMSGKDWKVELSGRRAGMVHRALLAYRAIDLAKCDLDSRRSLRNLKDMFKTVLKMTIPVGITSTGSSGVTGAAANSIASNVDTFSGFFTETNSQKARCSIDVIYELLTTKSIARKTELLTKHVTDDIAKNQVWSDLISKNKDLKTYEGVRNAITIGLVAHLMTVNPNIVPKAMQSLIAKEGQSILKIADVTNSIDLKGQMVFYEKEISSTIDGYKDPFVRLQAKILFEQACHENSGRDITSQRFSEIINSIKTECSSLERMLKDHAQLLVPNTPKTVQHI